MSILQELLSLREAPEAPIELADVIKAFPTHHGKALSKLWGGSRLVWHGDRFFSGNDLGPAYLKAIKAAHTFIDEDYSAMVDQEFEFDGEMHDFHWQAEFDPRETQECYVGYDPKNDKLYVGFDAWIGEESFNEAFDSEFEAATGTPHDSDDEDHAASFSKVWQEFREQHGFWGLVFEVSHDGDSYQVEEAFPPMPGGFYKGTRPQLKSRNLVDIRLD